MSRVVFKNECGRAVKKHTDSQLNLSVEALKNNKKIKTDRSSAVAERLVELYHLKMKVTAPRQT